MRFSMLFAGLVASSAVACGGSDDNGGGGSAGKGGSNAAGSSAGGTSGSATAGGGSGGGGTGSGTPGKVDSGLPEDKPAGELTDEQFDALCESYGEAAASVLSEDAKKVTCGFAGYFAAQLSGAAGADAKAACQTAYEECLAEPAEPEVNECTKPSEACVATVGEIEACFNDQIALAKSVLAELPGCDDLGADYELPSENELPASCEVLREKCPEALE